MRIETMKKGRPAPAENVQESLDIVMYILNIFTTLFDLITSILDFAEGE